MDTQTFVIVSVIKMALVLWLLLTAVAYIVLLERKVLARMQNRWGPTRVGPFGLLQPLADGIKFILKEDVTPPDINRALYVMAPMLALGMALLSIVLIPFGPDVTIAGVTTPLQITDTEISLLIIFAATSLGVYGIALAGWASNSKYSLLGSLRASAQMISYELALGMSLVGVLLIAGTLSLREIVLLQAGGFWNWNFFGGLQFIGFFIFLAAAYAETNRVPFDLPEAETELVAGYHTEYSAMKFAMFFMAEYTAMVTVGAVATTLFFGGWWGPIPLDVGPEWLQPWYGPFWFVVKVFLFIFLYIWVRGTLPRFRFDQLMAFGWKFLLPLAIANIVVTSLLVALGILGGRS